MRAMGKSGDAKSRRVTPPSPSYMSNDQFASYLSELRSNRISRPGGARPQPSGARPAPSRTSTGRSSIGRSSIGRSSIDASSQTGNLPSSQRQPSQAPSLAGGSISSRYSMSSAKTRDYYPANLAAPLKPSEVIPTATYMERGQRWMEKEESHSLRDAMEEMDLRDPSNPASDDETRLYNAALDEAAELVWEHQNGPAPPRPDGPYRYRPHMRKNSYAHARTASVGKHGHEVAPSGLARDFGSRSASASSSDSDGLSQAGRPSVDSMGSREQARREPKPYGSVGSRASTFPEGRRRSSMKRNISGEVERPFSGDQIWEEPESISPSGTVKRAGIPTDTLGNKSNNPTSRVRFEPSREDLGSPKPLNSVEIHRNPPSRSRNAQYLINAGLPSTPSSDDHTEKKDGVEIRSDDIRAATSMRLSDRSPKLPEPTAVSDNPGRPIVSFDANWKAPEESTDIPLDERQALPGPAFSKPNIQPQTVVIPTITVAEDFTPRPRSSPHENIPSICLNQPHDGPKPQIPTINVPTIAVDETPRSGNRSNSIPVINVPGDGPSKSARPLPMPGTGRQPPRQVQRPRGHWSPAPGTQSRLKTSCHECGFPIDGRFVALAGSTERFHPQCLSCYSCGTSLEAMEISPEPDQVRKERLDRIQRRAAGEVLDEEPGSTMAEDGDERMRFYCHLDWHELFAPRCKHCTTPIMGEHIVALGQHWHYGHFFCAECGDPFEQGMTHIEKDGYAWCIKCQTKRTERRAPKCRKCKTAVIGQYIEALGGEWHEHCFRCAECQGGFDDGQIFPKEVEGGLVVLCTGCRAMELKR